MSELLSNTMWCANTRRIPTSTYWWNLSETGQTRCARFALESIVAVLVLILLLASAATARGQEAATLSGVVVNTWDGTPLSGVVVTVRGTTLATQTDANGRFILHGVPPGDQVLRFSKSGYAAAVVTDVRVLLGQTTTVNPNLRPEFYEMEEYEVTAEELATQEATLLFERQTGTGISEAIGEERFSRLAAGDLGEIMTKITGVSVVEGGKFAVIRGLADRYNLALLNGGEVPSSDPYRRSIQLNLFPSDVIQSVTVSKTFTPDLPGSFSGGLMNVETKSFPEKFVFKVSSGLGYNTQSTFNDDFLTYPGGGLDAFAMDDGTRAFPKELEGVTGDQLQDLLTIAQTTPRNVPLEPKTAARNQIEAYVRSFGSPHMGPEREAPPVDHDFSALFGNTVKVGGRPLGIYAGLSYERDYRFYDNGVRRRYSPESALQRPKATQDFEDSRSTTVAQWSSLVNLGYQPFDGHELGFNFLYVQNAEDEARKQFGRISTSGENQFADQRRTHLNKLHWTERNLTSFQLQGNHELPPAHGLKVDWLAGLANTTQDEPDLRYFNFITAPSQDPLNPLPEIETGNSNTPFPDKPVRYWRNLEDENLNGKIDFTLPGEDWRGLEWKLKAGALANRTTRDFKEQTFNFDADSSQKTNANPETFPFNYLRPPYYLPAPLRFNQVGRPFYDYSLPTSRALDSFYGNNEYNGEQKIDAAYGMAELPLLPSLRLIGGVRYEGTHIDVTSTAFQTTNLFTAEIDQVDLLPGMSLLYTPRKDMNVRLSYSQTIARPTFRELATYYSPDPAEGDEIIQGNPNLKIASIENFDLRWEWFTKAGGLLSVGGFYKLLTDPIEKFNASIDPTTGEPIFVGENFVTWLNTDEATVWGVEFEARQNLSVIDSLLQPFSIGLNFAWIESEVDLDKDVQDMKFQTTGKRFTTRPLYDQSPYIINADISYDNEHTGTSVTLAYYYAAERLYLIVNNAYDVYEQPAPSLDLVISQRLSKHFKVKFSAENLLNPRVIRSYAVDGPTDKEFIYSSYTRGITFGLSLSAIW